jgi:hypothetical protein
MEEGPLRDGLLQCAGVIAILAALIHGVLSEVRVFRSVSIEPRRLRTLVRLVFQLLTVDWICFGLLLLLAPTLASELARHAIVIAATVALAMSALVNALGSKGRHFGWIVLGAAATMAAAGY